MTGEAEARVGISGWVYPNWRGEFYPKGLRQADELEFASRQLTSIEVNGSFYALQKPANWVRWRDAVPDDFVFAVKGPRFITHLKRLGDIDAPLANFLASGLLALGEKLGPVLWQLPPNLGFDEPLLDAFLARLPRTHGAAAALARHREERMSGRSSYALRAAPERPLEHAVEVRHPSFEEHETTGEGQYVDCRGPTPDVDHFIGALKVENGTYATEGGFIDPFTELSGQAQ